MLPQHVLEEDGYHVKGKTDPEHQALLEDAQALADAGAFAIVLELVTPPVAKEISRRISIPTIGIGSGDGLRRADFGDAGSRRHSSRGSRRDLSNHGRPAGRKSRAPGRGVEKLLRHKMKTKRLKS